MALSKNSENTGIVAYFSRKELMIASIFLLHNALKTKNESTFMHSKEKSYTLALFACASLLLTLGLFFPPVASVQNVDASNPTFESYIYGNRWYTELKMGQRIEFSYESDTPVKLWIIFHQMPVTEMSHILPSSAQLILDEPTASYSYAFTVPRDNVYSFIVHIGENIPISEATVNAKATIHLPYAIHMTFVGLSLCALGILILQRRVTDWTHHFNSSLKVSIILLLTVACASIINDVVGFSFLFAGYETIVEAIALSSLTFTGAFFIVEFMSRKAVAEFLAAIKLARTRDVLLTIISFLCLNITFIIMLTFILAGALVARAFPLLNTTVYRGVNEIVLTNLGFFFGLSGIVIGNLYLIRLLKLVSKDDYSRLWKRALSVHFVLGIAMLILGLSPFNSYIPSTLQAFIYSSNKDPISWLVISALETGAVGYAVMTDNGWKRHGNQWIKQSEWSAS